MKWIGSILLDEPYIDSIIYCGTYFYKGLANKYPYDALETITRLKLYYVFLEEK